MSEAAIFAGVVLILAGIIAAIGFWPVALVLVGCLAVGYGIAKRERWY